MNDELVEKGVHGTLSLGEEGMHLDIPVIPNIVNKEEKMSRPDTINGLPRHLVEQVQELLIEFWNKQPPWGDAALEYSTAEKLIHLIKKEK